MRERRCEHCEWWDDGGNCRRYAPRPVLHRDVTESRAAIWPNTAFEDYCGEFQEVQE